MNQKKNESNQLILNGINVKNTARSTNIMWILDGVLWLLVRVGVITSCTVC